MFAPGVGMNDTKNLRLQIAEVGEAILGENLLGLQVGNEPDLYGWYILTATWLFPWLIQHALLSGTGWVDARLRTALLTILASLVQS